MGLPAGRKLPEIVRASLGRHRAAKPPELAGRRQLVLQQELVNHPDSYREVIAQGFGRRAHHQPLVYVEKPRSDSLKAHAQNIAPNPLNCKRSLFDESSVLLPPQVRGLAYIFLDF